MTSFQAAWICPIDRPPIKEGIVDVERGRRELDLAVIVEELAAIVEQIEAEVAEGADALGVDRVQLAGRPLKVEHSKLVLADGFRRQFARGRRWAG